MRVQRMLVPLSLALMGLSGCNVYDRWDGGEFNAGPVDASNFPPEYLGTNANRQRAGSGSFTARKAMAGTPLEYFLFSITAGQRTAKDPLAVRSNGNAVSAVPTPSTYVFDGCTAPEGYSYDADRDDVPYDQQGAIFTRLPTATYAAGAAPTTTYVPVIQKVAVTGQDVACQKLKSEKTVVASKEIQVSLTEPVNGKQFGIPDSTFHAYAVIEPGAAVFHANLKDGKKDPESGVGLQKWGWFNQYLLAYLDGGEIPTTEVTAGGVTTVRMVTQKLYYPRSAVTGVTGAVSVGQGYDVLAAKRGEPGYSPVCEVLTYDAGGALTPAQLPTTETQVLELSAKAKTAISAPATGDKYVYCLQVE